MAKRRRNAGEQLLLIPFLDILCSLIGVLILIIVVLCVSQTRQTNGRTPEELSRAQEYQRLLVENKDKQSQNKDLAPKLDKLETVTKESHEKSDKVAKLRRLLATSAEEEKQNKSVSENLLKELDNLLLEIDGLKQQDNPLKKEIATLTAELQKRQIPPEKRVPPVMVQPGGSGLARDTKLFFVEVSGGKVVMYWNAAQKTQISDTPEVVVADVAYNYFLKQVHATPNARLIFLMRDDGLGAYNNAAGWAQGNFGFKAEQIGKLPLPGRGEVNLGLFKQNLGILPPPPEAKLIEANPAPVAAPATTPAPQP